MVVSILAVVFVDEVSDDAVDGLFVFGDATEEGIGQVEAVLRHEAMSKALSRQLDM